MKNIKYILVEISSKAVLAKIFNMFSDIGFPNVTFYSQRTKNSCSSKDLNGIVMITLRSSPISEKLQVRLDSTSWE